MATNNKKQTQILGWILVGIFMFFLGFIVINEYTLQTGEKVFLETAPVDPRDLLRGDYVILSYKIQQDPQVLEFISEHSEDLGDFYLVLDVDENQRATLKNVSKRKPDDELFIKANYDASNWRERVGLGIGKYFVPETQGRVIEKIRSEVEVQVSIDDYGVAKIIDLYHQGKKIKL